MIATEYDKIEPTFRIIMDNYEKKCVESGVSFYFCYTSLMYMFETYGHSKNIIKIIERLDFSDEHRVKVLLNKASFGSKDEELSLAKKNFSNLKKKLFLFLDNTKEPYFFILHPFYKYGSGIAYKKVPYIKDNASGIQNIDIACDYFKYKLEYSENGST